MSNSTGSPQYARNFFDLVGDVTPEAVHQLYGKVGQKRMSCGKCGVPESPPNQYQWCSGCHLIPYCSRKCQKEDWKRHKKQCHDDNTVANRILHRMEMFINAYYPMLARLLTLHLGASLLCKSSNITPQDHFVLIHVSDLPKPAKRPRLRIDKICTKPFSEISREGRKQLKHKRTSLRAQNSILLVLLHSGQHSQYLCPPVNADLLDTMKRLGSAADENTKRQMSIVPLRWIQAINGMANGERMDLIEAAEKTKEKNM